MFQTRVRNPGETGGIPPTNDLVLKFLPTKFFQGGKSFCFNNKYKQLVWDSNIHDWNNIENIQKERTTKSLTSKDTKPSNPQNTEIRPTCYFFSISHRLSLATTKYIDILIKHVIAFICEFYTWNYIILIYLIFYPSSLCTSLFIYLQLYILNERQSI